MDILNKQFNTSFAHATLKRLFYKYNLKITDYRDSSVLKKYNYDKNKIQEMFDFYIKNNITQKTMKIFNKQFNTSFAYAALKSLFYKYNLKISDYRDCPSLIKYSYDKNKIQEMFDFYIKNNITQKTMKIFNKQFNTVFTNDQLIGVFYRNNLKVSDYRDGFIFTQKYNYDKNQIQEIFDFYIKNNISPKTISILNKQFNANFTSSGLKRLFYKYNLKISDRRDCSILKRKYNYDKNKVQEMFDFYIKNNISSKTMDIFNKQFNTSFTIDKLRQLFYRNNLKISNYRVAVV